MRDVTRCRHCGVPIYRSPNGSWWHSVSYKLLVKASREHGIDWKHGAQP